jgi:predicted ester cyclase
MGKSFSGLTFTVHDMIAEGDKVAAMVTMSGTNVGEFMGMPATNKKIEVPVADYFRLRNGKVAEHWGVTDTGRMQEQLGGS